MPFHINLLHEEQALDRERRQDPLKIGGLILLLIGLVLIGVYFFKSNELRRHRQSIATLTAEVGRKTPLMEEAALKEVEHNDLIARAELLTDMAEGRFHWGPFLEGLLKAVPGEMSLSSLNGSVMASPDMEAPGHMVSVELSGQTAGVDPRSVAENLRLAFLARLQESNQDVRVDFESLEDDTVKVNLDGRTLPTARFTINISFLRPTVKEEASE